MERINALLHFMKEKGIDGFLVSSKSNVTYLSKFSGDSSLLFVTPGRTVLLTDGRYTEQAAGECYGEIEIFSWIDNERYGIKTYRHFVNEFSIKQLGIEGHIMSVSTYKMLNEGLPNLELVSLEGTVEKLRQIKDQSEIEALRRACEISVEALQKTVTFIKPGIREIELTARLEYNLKVCGAENLSFDTIVLSGSRTSLLHGKPGEKKLEKGEFVLFDFGALYNGYHADISRTFILGEPDEEQRELYQVVQQAQMSALKSIKPAISATVPDEKVRKAIPEKYLPFYYPGMGHGVGLDIHEEPFIRQGTVSRIEKNMVLTIEPGIYIPGKHGIRIEDTVVVTDNSFELLTVYPREMIVLH